MSPKAAPPIDDDEDDDGEVAPSRVWLWVMRGMLLAVGLFVGVGLPYVWYLDKQVRTEFAQLQWQVPTRVYARPLLLKSGIRLNPEAFEIELAAAGYHKDGAGKNPGTYRRDGGRFRLSTRAFNDMDGPVPARHLDVQLSNGRLLQLRDGEKRKRIESARVDPARIATLYGISEEERRLVRLEDVPALMITGLQSVEDRNFKSHHGIDPWGVMRAIWVNMREAEFEQGASTLTQQMVRTLFLSNTKTISRKLKEALYALMIEARFDKRRILEAYLNQIYLGQQGNQSIHGVAAASEFWFGRDLRRLQTEDIALLVGMIQGPGYESAHASRARDPPPPRGAGRVRRHRADHADEGERAKGQPLGVSERPGVARNRDPAFMDLVQRQLARDYPGRRAARRRPDRADHAVALGADAGRTRGGQRCCRRSSASRARRCRSGMVVTDASSGEVLAMVGNRDSRRSRAFNRALRGAASGRFAAQAHRVPAGAGAAGTLVAGELVDDAPVEVTLPNGKSWRPKNSDGAAMAASPWPTRSRTPTTRPRCASAWKWGRIVWPSCSKVLAGLRAPPNPSLILGSVDLSPFVDGADVPVPRLRRPRSSRCARCAACSIRKGKAISRYDFKRRTGAGGRRDRRAPGHARAAGARCRNGTGAAAALRRPGPAAVGRQDRHQQRQPRQLVRRLHRRPPGRGVGGQRRQRAHRPVRRHRRDARVVGAVHQAAQRAAATLAGQGLEWAGWIAATFATTENRLRRRAPRTPSCPVTCRPST